MKFYNYKGQERMKCLKCDIVYLLKYPCALCDSQHTAILQKDGSVTTHSNNDWRLPNSRW